MKVALVVRSDGFAGVEAHILALAPAVADLGVEVRVIGGDPARMVDPLHANGIEHYPAASVQDVVKQAIGLRAWIPDVIHSHMTAAEVGVVVAYPALRAPMVSTRHFAETRGPGTRWERPYRLLDRVAHQVSVSEAVAEAIRTPSTVIHPGITQPPPDRERSRIILVAQRLEDEKDTLTALRAFHASGLAADGWQLKIAGSGSKRSEIEHERTRTRLGGSVELLGFRSDVRDLMAQASIFLATSPFEHFGISVVEAMAAGTPVVATARAGHLETAGAVSPETLFEPGDAASAANLLSELAADPSRRLELGRSLRADYLARFTVEECARRHHELYESLLS